MGRPPKMQRVDYFPHMNKHGKTMLILNSRYGNDGYAFWFKLLEMLSAENGHYLDAKQPDTWEFLKTTALLDDQKSTEILDLLAKLGAIDTDLWVQDKVIWSQNLVDNLTHVYAKRKTAQPEKPSLRSGNPVKPEFPAQKPEQSGVSVTEIRQRIGQDRIGQELRETVSDPETQNPKLETQNSRLETESLGPLHERTLSLLCQVYPQPGQQVGLQDGQVAAILDDEIPVADHGPLLTAAKNYAEKVLADKTAPQFIRQLPSFLRDGYWRNFVNLKPTGTGPPGTVPDRSWKETEAEDRAKFEQEIKSGAKRPEISRTICRQQTT